MKKDWDTKLKEVRAEFEARGNDIAAFACDMVRSRIKRVIMKGREVPGEAISAIFECAEFVSWPSHGDDIAANAIAMAECFRAFWVLEEELERIRSEDETRRVFG